MRYLSVFFLVAVSFFPSCMTPEVNQTLLDATMGIVQEYNANSELLVGDGYSPGLLDLMMAQNPDSLLLKEKHKEVVQSRSNVALLADQIRAVLTTVQMDPVQQAQWIDLLNKVVEALKTDV